MSLCLMFLTLSIGYSQTVQFAPKKTVYTRKGKDVPKEKRTFVVTYPLFNGAIPIAARKNLEKTISYWRVFETTLLENTGDNHWLSEMSYQINYNKNGILDIALTQEGVGAYPDSSTVELIVDLKTGEQVKFTDAFKKESLTAFAKMVDVKLKAEAKEVVGRIDKGEFGDVKEEKEANDSVKEQLNNLEFTTESFNEYSISDQGVTILYDAGFPHVIQAAQPDGRYFFTWEQVKPFIRRDGLLGKFVR